jgi:hypothetical protein
VYFEGNVTKGWKFNGKKAIVESLPHSHQVDITWPRPESDLISTNKDLIVYVLLSRDKSIRGHTDWQEITQVSINTLKYHSQHRLVLLIMHKIGIHSEC